MKIKSLSLENLPFNTYCNQITCTMDAYLKPEYKKVVDQGYCYPTYMQRHNKNIISIRFPGATRGHVVVDNNNVICEIVIYDDIPESCNCYKDGVEETLKQFKGNTLILEEL